MAKNISLLGADYPGVPAVQLPQTGGGTATFYDINFESQLITISPDSNGSFIMDVDFDTFVSMSCADASNSMCFVRKTLSGKCLVFSYDDSMHKLTSGTYKALVWTKTQ